VKNGVKDEIYYFLLDWKDKNLEGFQAIKGIGARLCDLTPYELNKLYEAIKTEEKLK
jgi:hypothetical protein